MVYTATNLSIDPELLETALEVSGLKTKKDTVQDFKHFADYLPVHLLETDDSH